MAGSYNGEHMPGERAGNGQWQARWWRVGWGLARLDWLAGMKVRAQGVQLPVGGGGDVVGISGMPRA